MEKIINIIIEKSKHYDFIVMHSDISYLLKNYDISYLKNTESELNIPKKIINKHSYINVYLLFN